jgi:hypothetical protein
MQEETVRRAQTNTHDSPTQTPTPAPPRTYKGFIGPAPCTSCPANSSTAAGRRASVAVTDCNSCKPGYGGLAVTAGAPACSICASGTYSVGYKAGGPACDACPQLANYTGRMVSRQGALDVSECFGEFTSDGADRAPLAYDFIPMEAAALTAITAAAANASAAGCQAACTASNECQARAWPAHRGRRCLPRHYEHTATFGPRVWGVARCRPCSPAGAPPPPNAPKTLPPAPSAPLPPQYFVSYWAGSAPDGSANTCYHRLTPLSYSTKPIRRLSYANWDAPTDAVVMFEVGAPPSTPPARRAAARRGAARPALALPRLRSRRAPGPARVRPDRSLLPPPPRPPLPPHPLRSRRATTRCT